MQRGDMGWIRASDDVDRYADRAADEVLASRERGRDLFSTIREAGIYVSEWTTTGD